MALDEESETDCNAYSVLVQCSDGSHHFLDQMSIEQPARPNEQPVADRDEVGTLLALPPPLLLLPNIYTLLNMSGSVERKKPNTSCKTPAFYSAT